MAAPNEWSWEYAQKVLNQAYNMGIKWLAIGGGEPTEVPWLNKFLLEAYLKKIHTTVTTNGCNLGNFLEVNRIHISHDSMHAQGAALTWEEREDQVLKAIRHYRKVAELIGLNVIWTDLDRIGRHLLEEVDVVTAILPKPIKLEEGWKDKFLAAWTRCSEHVHVSVDGCLVSLAGTCAGHNCSQGKISMALDQQGRASVCSNIASPRIEADKLQEQWRQIRCMDYKATPRGCLVADVE